MLTRGHTTLKHPLLLLFSFLICYQPAVRTLQAFFKNQTLQVLLPWLVGRGKPWDKQWVMPSWQNPYIPAPHVKRWGRDSCPTTFGVGGCQSRWRMEVGAPAACTGQLPKKEHPGSTPSLVKGAAGRGGREGMPNTCGATRTTFDDSAQLISCLSVLYIN